MGDRGELYGGLSLIMYFSLPPGEHDQVLGPTNPHPMLHVGISGKTIVCEGQVQEKNEHFGHVCGVCVIYKKKNDHVMMCKHCYVVNIVDKIRAASKFTLAAHIQ